MYLHGTGCHRIWNVSGDIYKKIKVFIMRSSAKWYLNYEKESKFGTALDCHEKKKPILFRFKKKKNKLCTKVYFMDSFYFFFV